MLDPSLYVLTTKAFSYLLPNKYFQGLVQGISLL